jgi:hypothetical protein
MFTAIILSLPLYSHLRGRSGATNMVKFTILAGGYSLFIATYLFDSDTSSLSLLTQTQTGQNPSWITSHPQNTSIL